MKTTRLIGTEWKCGDTWSGCVLIGRGLFLRKALNDRLIRGKKLLVKNVVSGYNK